jgi:hypothetical protein
MNQDVFENLRAETENNTFQDRITQAIAFEDRLIAELQSMPNWNACKFGQALIPKDCADGLRHHLDKYGRPSLLRWLPDVLACHNQRGAFLFDAKTTNKSNKTTTNYAIEQASVETANAIQESMFQPTYFVFEDMKILSVRTIKERAFQGPSPASGSGTAYFLIDKKWGLDFKSWAQLNK